MDIEIIHTQNTQLNQVQFHFSSVWHQKKLFHTAGVLSSNRDVPYKEKVLFPWAMSKIWSSKIHNSPIDSMGSLNAEKSPLTCCWWCWAALFWNSSRRLALCWALSAGVSRISDSVKSRVYNSFQFLPWEWRREKLYPPGVPCPAYLFLSFSETYCSTPAKLYPTVYKYHWIIQ